MAMLDPYLDNVSWFDDYDWLMQVNPDVLICADGWLIQTMLNTSIDMIVHECFPEQINGKDNITLHTDFFAIILFCHLSSYPNPITPSTLPYHSASTCCNSVSVPGLRIWFCSLSVRSPFA